MKNSFVRCLDNLDIGGKVMYCTPDGSYLLKLEKVHKEPLNSNWVAYPYAIRDEFKSAKRK